jgi:hypothetical protein
MSENGTPDHGYLASAVFTALGYPPERFSPS